MSLWTRLTNPDPDLGEEKIPVHAFGASVGEYERGEITFQQFVNAAGLDAGEEAALQSWWTGVYTAGGSKLTREIVEDVLILRETGWLPDAAAKTRLGM